MDITKLSKKLIEFRNARNWKQFHNPKNLAISLSLEANELLEIFQWLDLDQSKDLDDLKLQDLKDEIADVAIYLLFLCDEFGIDLEQAIDYKMLNSED